MPCSCDGYEVSDTSKIYDLREKVRALEGQLCNAQSLIHKLLKHIDASAVGREPLPRHLRTSANEHVKVLLDHKKAEHQRDLDRMIREVESLARTHEQQLRAAEGQRLGAEKTLKALNDLRDRLDAATKTSDKDILG